MKRYVPIVVVITAMLCACASEPPLEDTLRPRAMSAGQQRGASELGCPSATAEVIDHETIPEPQGTGWYEPPHQVSYTVDVSGCAKRATYSVACDDRKTGCVAGPVAAVSAAPLDLADQLQPDALKVAQQRGTSELGCPGATAKVLRAETIQKPQGTGWYEPPQRALYTVDVSGCGKQLQYLVACDSQKKQDCVAGTMQKTAPPGQPQLADELRPDALQVAQQHGATELGCPAATAKVQRQETIEEPQTTGWYEPPHRAVYTIVVSGCGKDTSYLVACDDRKSKGCVAGSMQSQARQ
jgi:hypothetical protein